MQDLLNNLIDLNDRILQTISVNRPVNLIKKKVKEEIIPKIEEIKNSNGTDFGVDVLLDYMECTFNDCIKEDFIRMLRLNNSFFRAYVNRKPEIAKPEIVKLEDVASQDVKMKIFEEWTADEDKIIMRDFPRMSVTEMLDKNLLPGRNENQIYRRAHNLGLKKNKYKKRKPGKTANAAAPTALWTVDEINVLEDIYLKKSVPEIIGENLLPNKTKKQIYKKAYEMGLKKYSKLPKKPKNLESLDPKSLEYKLLKQAEFKTVALKSIAVKQECVDFLIQQLGNSYGFTNESVNQQLRQWYLLNVDRKIPDVRIDHYRNSYLSYLKGQGMLKVLGDGTYYFDLKAPKAKEAKAAEKPVAPPKIIKKEKSRGEQMSLATKFKTVQHGIATVKQECVDFIADRMENKEFYPDEIKPLLKEWYWDNIGRDLDPVKMPNYYTAYMKYLTKTNHIVSNNGKYSINKEATPIYNKDVEIPDHRINKDAVKPDFKKPVSLAGLDDIENYVLDWCEKNNTHIIDVRVMDENRIYNSPKYNSIDALYKGLKSLEEKDLAKQVDKRKFIIYMDKIKVGA